MGRALVLTWIVAFTVAFPFTRGQGQTDPLSLQRRAIERIDRYVDHYRRTGDFKTQVAELQHAKQELATSGEAFRARGDHAAVALGLIKLGKIQRMLTDWDAAIASYQQAEQAALHGRRPDHQAAALTGRSTAESSKHDYGAALSHARRAVQLAEAGEEKGQLFDALDALAQAQIGAGNLAAAADMINRALSVGANDEARLYYGYLDRADVRLKTAEKCDYKRTFPQCDAALDLARSDYRTAVDLASKLGFAGLADAARRFMAEVEQRRELFKAQQRLVEDVDRVGIFHPKRASDVLVTEHFVSKGTELPPGLVEVYREAKAKLGVFAGVTGARDRYVEGMIQQANGDDDAALASFLAAIAALERDRRSLKDETSRGTFLEDKIGFYYAAVLQLLQQGRTPEAFELMERSKSRAMADLLADRRVALARPGEQRLYGELVELRARIALLQNESFALASGAGADRQEESRADLDSRIRALEAEHERLLARIETEAPRLRELVVAAPVSLGQIQEAMRAEQFELLEYLVLEHGVILWHVSADSVHVRNVFIPRAQLSAKIAALQKSLEDRNSAFDTATAGELFLFLVQPALRWVKDDRLILVPHEDLHHVPFQVFRNPADGRFFGERYRISYAPSATVLHDMSKAAAVRQGRLFAAADPDIPAATGEVLSIAKRFGPGSKLIVHRLVTKAEVRRFVARRDIVHLSVHGYYVASEPLLSYVALREQEKDDGKLTAAEMFGLPLEQTRLLVLSACETGKAEATHGNEIVGMIRALLYARAGTLVLSYWKVDSEATALWMETFYSRLSNSPPSEAARAALRTVKARDEYSHPYYWAAFMVVGR